MTNSEVKDRIRGCLIGGAIGDALGYAVEFVGYQDIVAKYGENGITKFDLFPYWKEGSGKAEISDDTQMTLFTAEGLLNGMKQSGFPDWAVKDAYIDWYYTQYPSQKEGLAFTSLRDNPRLCHRRAPGGTCLDACRAIIDGMEVVNDSKGCGGIMRVAPIALLSAALQTNDGRGYADYEVAIMADNIAGLTHKHPLGHLPAALLAVLLDRILWIDSQSVLQNFGRLVVDSLDLIKTLFSSTGEADMFLLRHLVIESLNLADSSIPTPECLNRLGQGWVAEETLAVALFCAKRYINDPEQAIIASVNHDGDSDSTGSVCGNIMGAIYGYEYLNANNVCCPDGHDLEDTLELSDIILDTADRLAASKRKS